MQNTKVVRVLVDCTFLFDQYSQRGIGRVGKEVVSRLIPLFFNNDIEVHIASFETLEVNLIKLGFSQFLIEELAQRVAFTSFGKPELSGV